jgi:hypothetical protein
VNCGTSGFVGCVELDESEVDPIEARVELLVGTGRAELDHGARGRTRGPFSGCQFMCGATRASAPANTAAT